MEYMRNFKWPSIYRVACPKYRWNLHFSIVSEARNAGVTLVKKPQIKIFSFLNGKHVFLMQYLVRQSFEGYCCESEYILFLFLIFSLGECNAMQCNVEYRLPAAWGRSNIKRTPTPMSPPVQGIWLYKILKRY